jgi:Zn-dependent M16 (insulinase) family peptidase
MDAIGVYKDGEVVDFEEMQNRTRREILNLNVYPSFNMQEDRAELVVRAAGSNLEELHNAIGWMEAVLYSPYLSVENLPRIKDVIDQGQVGLRNRMKGSEENWVNDPASAYRYQTSPLYLSSQSFLTQIHAAERARWLFTDPGSAEDQETLEKFFATLADMITEMTVSDVAEAGDTDSLIVDAPREMKTNIPERNQVLNAHFGEDEDSQKIAEMLGPDASEKVKEIARDVVKSLRATLPEIPDANLEEDWTYLCDQIKADLMTGPEVSIVAINHMLDLVRKADNARMFMISSTSDREATMDRINAFSAKLDSGTPSVRQEYASIKRILERARGRNQGMGDPLYVGFLNENTRNGVLIFSSKASKQYDMSEDGILNCLASKLYGGGGTHGLFMRTWAAGLAYSNGYGYGAGSGFARYYAERCPDAAETMRFVVDVLKTAEENPHLTEYAVAQVFGRSRAASRYESRGEAMAANLADGVTPEVVSNYRKAILAARSRENLYPELVTRMKNIYGQVLVGYGPPLSESKDGVFYMIGPEAQFESMERYIEANEGKHDICRLYPRDYWLTNQ